VTSPLRKLMRTAVTVLVVALPPLAPLSAPVPAYQPTVKPAAALPGTSVTVTFPRDDPEGRSRCGAEFAVPDEIWRDPPDEYCGEGDDHPIELPVPALGPQTIELRWIARFQKSRDRLEAHDSIPFEVLAPDFEVHARPSSGSPKKQVEVTFQSPEERFHITGCSAGFAGSWKECDGDLTAHLVVPEIAVSIIDWRVTYTIDPPDSGPIIGLVPAPDPSSPPEATGSIPFRVILPPKPDPEFDVVAKPSLAGPGDLVTVEFTSRTAGFDVASCSVGPVACGGDDKAVVRVPADARAGSTISMPWHLAFSDASTDVRDGKIQIQVQRPAEPCFTAAVEPAAAAAGQPVTVAFTSLCGGFNVVRCLVFFPSDLGGQCQRSRERWFARTTVPLGTPAGMTVLRWGVESRTDDGRLGADNNGIAYQVLPPPVRPPPGPTNPRPTRSIEPGPQPSAGPPPRFVAMIDPEAAAPGEPVTAIVSPVESGVEITSCTVAFSRAAESSCRRTAGGWAAAVDVPADADPGALPLDWNVNSPSGGGGGTISYRVLGADELAPAAFQVLPDPGSVAPGDKLTVTWQSLVDGVTITGCGAGFSTQEMTPCRPSEHGWAAELTVPKSTPAGLGSLFWRLTYGRAGAAAENNTDGLLTLAVVDKPGWTWPGLLKAGGQLLLGGLALAALVGWRKVAERFRKRRPRAAEEDTENPDALQVVASQRTDRMELSTPDQYAPAKHGIRIVPHPGGPEVRLTEEVP
jgi:hypothetical protein